jgi:hypothetical protein
VATNDLGLYHPTGGDEFAPHLDIEAAVDSLAGRIVVPVPNTTVRDALAASVSPSASEPLYVHRADAPAGARTEVTENGTTWRTVGASQWIGEVSMPTITPGNTANANFTFPAGWFSTAPMVVASTRLASTCTVTAGTPTTSGVAVTVRNVGTMNATPVAVLYAVVAQA